MSDKVQEIAATISVSKELLRGFEFDAMSFGFIPDKRTAAEKAADLERYTAQGRVIRARFESDHAELASKCPPLLLPVLELHGPRFSYELARYPECEGCDAGSHAEDSPSFPCRTYELIKSLVDGVPVEDS